MRCLVEEHRIQQIDHRLPHGSRELSVFQCAAALPDRAGDAPARCVSLIEQGKQMPIERMPPFVREAIRALRQHDQVAVRLECSEKIALLLQANLQGAAQADRTRWQIEDVRHAVKVLVRIEHLIDGEAFLHPLVHDDVQIECGLDGALQERDLARRWHQREGIRVHPQRLGGEVENRRAVGEGSRQEIGIVGALILHDPGLNALGIVGLALVYSFISSAISAFGDIAGSPFSSVPCFFLALASRASIAAFIPLWRSVGVIGFVLCGCGVEHRLATVRVVAVVQQRLQQIDRRLRRFLPKEGLRRLPSLFDVGAQE